MSLPNDDVPGLVEPGDVYPLDKGEDVVDHPVPSTEAKDVVHLPVPRLVKNPETGNNKLVDHTLEQYQDELAFCSSKLAEMRRNGMDLKRDGNLKLHKINRERRANGYPAILGFVYEDDITGVWLVRYLVEDGSRSMLPYCNDFPDTFIYDRLFKFKLILPDPFSEPHKTSLFCRIWGYNEDEYINRYHRWLADIDLLTEGVEEPIEVSSPSSSGSDLVNAGGVNLRKLERLIDNGPNSPGTGSSGIASSSPGSLGGSSSSGIIFDYDCGATGDDGDRKQEAIGSPRLTLEKIAQLDDEIDEILQRPYKWGIMTQLPADEDKSPPTEATNIAPTNEAAETPSSDTSPTDSKPPAKEDSDVTQEETDSNTEESEEEESPKKKQKTSEDEATIDGQQEDQDNETDQAETPYGVEILGTGSFSY
ncbi:expressed unknown protein [Seminavis robusta]|uniref:Uncharacterized protein n=1 Tax=Seminavis robusta TaxID=568900 RepID=A0A9N8EY15_9STRA|nr:expressed unknown protein [Seminavis robusta]|eukprot:Sro2349_g324360.1 n/a (421) ;mRNA; r:3671-4933